jgi:hypothetical protein
MKNVLSIPTDPCIGTINEPKLLNPEFEPLTIEKLKTFKGYENTSDEQAVEILESIGQFALVLYGAVKNIPVNNTDTIDNQLVVYLDSDSETQSHVIPIHKKLKNKVA